MADSDGYNSPVDFRIGRNPPLINDPNTASALADIYDFSFAAISTFVKYCGVGTISVSRQNTLRPEDTLYTGNLAKLYVPASVDLAAGHYVSLVNIAGILKAKLATSAPATVQTDGYVRAFTAAGNTAEIILQSGLNTVVGAGLVVGQRYWLGAGGGVRTTPDIAAGHLEQYLGIAVSTNSLWTAIGPAIQH